MNDARPGGRIGILGGSFNPVHIGHLRLALEIRELLQLDRTDILPCALPPHKPALGILPFELRVRLLRAATRGLPGLRINPLEGTRAGPSYTWDSLTYYKQREPRAQCFFILGCEDFAALPNWHRGNELPDLADFVVVPRDGTESARFLTAVRRIRPEAEPCPSENTPLLRALPGTRSFLLPKGTRLHYLPVTRLDISASLIRRRFPAKLDLRFLLPPAVLRLLEAEREAVTICWRGVRSEYSTG